MIDFPVSLVNLNLKNMYKINFRRVGVSDTIFYRHYISDYAIFTAIRCISGQQRRQGRRRFLGVIKLAQSY